MRQLSKPMRKILHIDLDHQYSIYKSDTLYNNVCPPLTFVHS